MIVRMCLCVYVCAYACVLIEEESDVDDAVEDEVFCDKADGK